MLEVFERSACLEVSILLAPRECRRGLERQTSQRQVVAYREIQFNVDEVTFAAIHKIITANIPQAPGPIEITLELLVTGTEVGVGPQGASLYNTLMGIVEPVTYAVSGEYKITDIKEIVQT